MHLSGLDLSLWVASLAGNVILLFVLLQKHRSSRFPTFTTLIAFYVARTLTLFFVFREGSQNAYFYTYWSLALVDVLLQLLVLLEVAFHVFRPAIHWAADLRRSLGWLLGVSVLLAGGLAWLAAPATKTVQQAIVIRGNFFSSVLMSEIFVGMIALSVTAGLPWKTHVYRIALGWGVYSIVSILVQGLQSYFGLARGSEKYNALSHLRIEAYLGSAAYWIVTLWRDAPEPRELTVQMNRQLEDLNRQVALTLRTLRPRKRA